MNNLEKEKSCGCIIIENDKVLLSKLFYLLLKK